MHIATNGRIKDWNLSTRPKTISLAKLPLHTQKETFKLMSFLTGNEELNLIPSVEEGGPETMYDAYKEAKNSGKKEGVQESTLNHIRSLMKNCHWTAQQAMDALSISIEDQKKFIMLL